MIFIMTMIQGSLAYGEEHENQTQKTIPTTPTEILQLYERTIKAGEKIKIHDDVIERAKKEINRIGTWEYRVITFSETQDTMLENRLNELGKERWECHVAPHGQDGIHLICKRPVRNYLKNIAIADLLKLIP